METQPPMLPPDQEPFELAFAARALKCNGKQLKGIRGGGGGAVPKASAPH